METKYLNTIIYKICCKDTNITDTYVGHTLNFNKRQTQHKLCCNNKSNVKLYNVINENGGWDNWEMVEIAKYNCKNLTEARVKEHEHYIELKATLNSVLPYIDNNTYCCNECSYTTINNFDFKKHCSTQKHINKINQINNINKINKNIICNNCLTSFNSKTTLWRHKKICIHTNNTNNANNNISNELKEQIINLVKTNKEFQKEMLNILLESLKTSL